MNFYTLSKFILLLSILLLTVSSINTPNTPHINSFTQLGQFHCESFPLQILYRLSSGTLGEKYGSKYSAIDCYVRQFVNLDGQNKQQYEQQSSQQQQEQQTSTEQQYIFPNVDPIVQKYSKGISKCLPQGVNQVQAVYKIWRFYRYVIQHDYLYQWMRAKVRSSLGYQAERPNAWMDGEQNVERVRLDKLFSNQFYHYVDKLMFRDFLFPVMTFLRKNIVVGLEGKLTVSGNSMLFQTIDSRNLHQSVFKPIVFSALEQKIQIFTYTLPGIPLFLGGSTSKVSWAYTGVLVDRSNIQQIQTVGSKFYHHGVQEWVKLNNVSISIPVKDQQDFTCTFMHSSYGTLYEKHNRSGKISQYIARWHQNQPRVRNLFTQSYNMIINEGNVQRDFDFPFNSIVIANKSGLFNYLCQQYHPSYFIYPDLASEPDALANRWITQPKKGIFVYANTHLTTSKQESYIKKQLQNSNQQQIMLEVRRMISQKKLSMQQLWSGLLQISGQSLIKKRKQQLIFMYRKSKFVFLPQQALRKQCDQLISILQKWDNTLNSQQSIVFVLWDYFFRDYTFNHVSQDPYGAHIVKHRVLTDQYWTRQPELWAKGVSYGECDSNQWHSEGWHTRLNGTGLNSTCFFNILRALNRTRQILRTQDGKISQNVQLSTFLQKKLIDLSTQYKGSNVDEAVGNFYSKNVGFVSEIGNSYIRFMNSYKQTIQNIDLLNYKNKSNKKDVKIDQQNISDQL